MTSTSGISLDQLEKLHKQVRELKEPLLEGFEWEYINKENFPGAAKLITNYFLKEEAAAVATKISDNPTAINEYLLYCADIALDSISTVVRDSKTKEVVACSFNKFVTPASENGEHFFDVFGKKYLTQPESKNLVIDFSGVTERTDIFKKYGINCSIEQVIWNIHPDYRNRKLSFLLVILCVDIIMFLEKGPVSSFTVADLPPELSRLEPREVTKTPPEAIHAICTSPITQTLSLKYGAVEADNVFFTELFYNGKSYEDILEDKGRSAMLLVWLRKDWTPSTTE